MHTIDKIIVFLAILLASILIFYVSYFFASELLTSSIAVITGIAGFLLGLFEFFRKK